MSRMLVIVAMLAITGFFIAQRRLESIEKRFHRPVEFRKTTLYKGYISEGVAVADVNRDGKLDILAGNVWFEGPAWKMHKIASIPHLDPAVDHSNSYVNFAVDLDKDGWTDQIVIGRPGEEAYWRKNPGRSDSHWQQFLLWRSACNESPQYSDLFNDGKRFLVFAFDNEYMSWFEPAPDPTKEFVAHPISEKTTIGTHKWSHGLGIGDINGDGRKDILCKDGYWEAPADRNKTPWRFVPANLGPECAHMQVYDVNGDGLADVVSSSAHAKGVWWYEQQKGGAFVQHTIDDSFSQSHSLVMADIDGDGTPDFVTGKRWWAHGPKGDVDPNAPAVLVWYELRKNQGKPEFIRHQIDDDSGVGVQFEVTDVNRDGLPDIVIANKKGIYYFEQQRL